MAFNTKIHILICILFVATLRSSQASTASNLPTYHVEKDEKLPRLQPVDPNAAVPLQLSTRMESPIKSQIKMDVGFLHAFVASLSVIIVSELGDKTFFIAAILSMRNPRITVFFGALSALVFMTILSAFLGLTTKLIPRWLTYYTSSALFAIFGLKMLKEAWQMDSGEAQEEYEEVQRELGKKEQESEKGQLDVEGAVTRTPQRRILYAFFSKVFVQSFMLTFLAEWGDRSQIATIILAARDEAIGVVLGGILGHALCTLLAVVAGRFLAQHISLKTVHFIGGIVFIIFSLSAFFIKPEDN